MDNIAHLWDHILQKALEAAASDVHIEPTQGFLRIRQRVGRRLYPLLELPKSLGQGLIARIKVLAGLNVAEQRRPQDGRLPSGQKGLDLRVATLPSYWGEALTLRLLPHRLLEDSWEALGMPAQVQEAFLKVLAQEAGLILLSGPTGSGKTTTLARALKVLQGPGKKIVTLEDPVEYHLEGITQVSVAPERGLSFSRLLEAFLRQDPDVILIGEIRDRDTAQAAARAALTGHLILSTVHAPDSYSVPGRLLDLGVDPGSLASTLLCVLAQRLEPTQDGHRVRPHFDLLCLNEALRQAIYDKAPASRLRQLGK